jgi:hypothetical protein
MNVLEMDEYGGDFPEAGSLLAPLASLLPTCEIDPYLQGISQGDICQHLMGFAGAVQSGCYGKGRQVHSGTAMKLSRPLARQLPWTQE